MNKGLLNKQFKSTGKYFILLIRFKINSPESIRLKYLQHLTILSLASQSFFLLRLYFELNSVDQNPNNIEIDFLTKYLLIRECQ